MDQYKNSDDLLWYDKIIGGQFLYQICMLLF